MLTHANLVANVRQDAALIGHGRGCFDADGCVYLVGRLKELIQYKALPVAPAELEDIIQSHPAALELDGGVVGAPDEAAGEIPVAFVVKRQGATLNAQEIMEYVAARVAPYKKIRAVESVSGDSKITCGKDSEKDSQRKSSGACTGDVVVVGSLSQFSLSFLVIARTSAAAWWSALECR